MSKSKYSCLHVVFRFRKELKRARGKNLTVWKGLNLGSSHATTWAPGRIWLPRNSLDWAEAAVPGVKCMFIMHGDLGFTPALRSNNKWAQQYLSVVPATQEAGLLEPKGSDFLTFCLVISSRPTEYLSQLRKARTVYRALWNCLSISVSSSKTLLPDHSSIWRSTETHSAFLTHKAVLH